MRKAYASVFFLFLTCFFINSYAGISPGYSQEQDSIQVQFASLRSKLSALQNAKDQIGQGQYPQKLHEDVSQILSALPSEMDYLKRSSPRADSNRGLDHVLIELKGSAQTASSLERSFWEERKIGYKRDDPFLRELNKVVDGLGAVLGNADSAFRISGQAGSSHNQVQTPSSFSGASKLRICAGAFDGSGCSQSGDMDIHGSHQQTSGAVIAVAYHPGSPVARDLNSAQMPTLKSGHVPLSAISVPPPGISKREGETLAIQTLQKELQSHTPEGGCGSDLCQSLKGRGGRFYTALGYAIDGAMDGVKRTIQEFLTISNLATQLVWVIMGMLFGVLSGVAALYKLAKWIVSMIKWAPAGAPLLWAVYEYGWKLIKASWTYNEKNPETVRSYSQTAYGLGQFAAASVIMLALMSLGIGVGKKMVGSNVGQAVMEKTRSLVSSSGIAVNAALPSPASAMNPASVQTPLTLKERLQNILPERLTNERGAIGYVKPPVDIRSSNVEILDRAGGGLRDWPQANNAATSIPEARLIDVLNTKGTTAVVFRGKLQNIGDDVAIKTFRPPGAARANGKAMDLDAFYNELQMAQRMEWALPKGMAPHSYGEVNVHGNPSYAMELICGKNVRDLTVGEAAEWMTPKSMRQMMKGIQALRDANLRNEDAQVMILTQDQVINGVRKNKGDVVFMDAGSFKRDVDHPDGMNPSEWIVVRIREMLVAKAVQAKGGRSDVLLRNAEINMSSKMWRELDAKAQALSRPEAVAKAASEDTLRQNGVKSKDATLDMGMLSYAYRVGKMGEQIQNGPENAIVGDWQGVSQERMKDFKKIGTQGAELTCARYGIAVCSIANGAAIALEQVKKAAADVISEGRKSDVKMGGAEAGSDPNTASSRLGDDVKIADRLSLKVEKLDASNGVYKAFIQGTSERGNPQQFIDASIALRQKVAQRLAEGQAVTIAVYSPRAAPGFAVSAHIVTVLGKGRNASGEEIARIFDSNSGEIVSVPWEKLLPLDASVYAPNRAGSGDGVRAFSSSAYNPDGTVKFPAGLAVESLNAAPQSYRAALARRKVPKVELTSVLSIEGSSAFVYSGKISGREVAVKVDKGPIAGGGRPVDQRAEWASRIKYFHEEIAFAQSMERALGPLGMAPKVYGEVDIGARGNPSYAMEKIIGKDVYMLTPAEAKRLISPETVRQVADGVRRLNEAGLGGKDSPQPMILTRDQIINGVQRRAGDVVFMDAGALSTKRKDWMTPTEAAEDVAFYWVKANDAGVSHADMPLMDIPLGDHTLQDINARANNITQTALKSGPLMNADEHGTGAVSLEEINLVKQGRLIIYNKKTGQYSVTNSRASPGAYDVILHVLPSRDVNVVGGDDSGLRISRLRMFEGARALADRLKAASTNEQSPASVYEIPDDPAGRGPAR